MEHSDSEDPAQAAPPFAGEGFVQDRDCVAPLQYPLHCDQALQPPLTAATQQLRMNRHNTRSPPTTTGRTRWHRARLRRRSNARGATVSRHRVCARPRLNSRAARHRTRRPGAPAAADWTTANETRKNANNVRLQCIRPARATNLT
jgi:hypothetical protein